MKKGNQSSATEFLLLGFSNHPEQQILLFFVFLTMYTIILLGNLTIIFIIRMDSRLHTPMYFFLSLLACVDICFTSTTMPKLLVDQLSQKKAIYFVACITQLFFFHSFGNMDSFMLGIMGFDRYMVIGHPLHYKCVMRKKFCVCLVLLALVVATLHSLMYCFLVSRLHYCGSYEIHHYFCDIPPLLKLSCSGTTTIDLLLLTEGSVIVITPLVCILVSYCRITLVILKIKSSDGRRKAFSTCISHLTSTVLFYGPGLFTYISPSSVYSLDKDIGISLMYSMVTSMLNPFVYSIRNNDVKEAFRKVRDTTHCHQ